MFSAEATDSEKTSRSVRTPRTAARRRRRPAQRRQVDVDQSLARFRALGRGRHAGNDAGFVGHAVRLWASPRSDRHRRHSSQGAHRRPRRTVSACNRSLRAVDRGDLIIHVIDGPEGVTDQDAQILSYAVQRGKALCWRSTSGIWCPERRRHGKISRRSQLPAFLFGLCADRIYFRGHRPRRAQIARDSGAWCKSTGARCRPRCSIRRCRELSMRTRVPLSQGRSVKFYYGTQTRTRPPTFALFVNRSGRACRKVINNI